MAVFYVHFVEGELTERSPVELEIPDSELPSDTGDARDAVFDAYLRQRLPQRQITGIFSKTPPG